MFTLSVEMQRETIPFRPTGKAHGDTWDDDSRSCLFIVTRCTPGDTAFVTGATTITTIANLKGTRQNSKTTSNDQR